MQKPTESRLSWATSRGVLMGCGAKEVRFVIVGAAGEKNLLCQLEKK